MTSLEKLKQKVKWVKRETLKLHKLAPETRLASSLSDIEIFVALYYGSILSFDSSNAGSEKRDRLIVSKGHGAVCLYPILADLNFFSRDELQKIGSKDSFLCVIPDTGVPGFETINGSLGLGLGVACGMAIALKRKKSDRKVFILCGDGELNCGVLWEAVMFAAFHKLNNLILIIDNNKLSMLGFQKDILGLEPLDKKFRAFGWKTRSVDGHNIGKLLTALNALKNDKSDMPGVLIADTRKGNGIPQLENDPLCHIKSLKPQEVDKILESWK